MWARKNYLIEFTTTSPSCLFCHQKQKQETRNNKPLPAFHSGSAILTSQWQRMKTLRQVSLKLFFIPDKKRVACLWHLSKFFCNKCSYSLFTTLYTLVFFACNKNTSSHKRANFREIKYLVHDNFFYWLESLFY